MTKKRSMRRAEPTTWPEVVAEAWAVRQEIERRLLLLLVEMARLERMRDGLDREFAGEPLPVKKEE